MLACREIFTKILVQFLITDLLIKLLLKNKGKWWPKSLTNIAKRAHRVRIEHYIKAYIEFYLFQKV